MDKKYSNFVSFKVNGELHQVGADEHVDVEMSLGSYLRNVTGMKGTKLMCREGGCGCCVVAVTATDPMTKKEERFAVNSCLVPIYASHGWNINVVDGIAADNTYHPIQKKLASFNGTQCGFCSGGMVMSMYALYEDNQNLTMAEVENSFGGNLCRCTGYRPILDAFKSLCSDAPPSLKQKHPELADIEDLKPCKKNGHCLKECKKREEVAEEEKRPVAVHANDQKWYKAYSFDELFEILKMYDGKLCRLVAGSTGKGVYKNEPSPNVYVDISSIPDLITHSVGSSLKLGANMTLTNTMKLFTRVAKQKPDDFWYLEKMVDHIDLVATVPVRNIGTLAGNLSLKHRHNEFPSDIFVLLEAIGAQLTIIQATDRLESTVDMAKYLMMDMDGKIIKDITLPPRPKSKFAFESFKIMCRAQNTHAYVNAGFLVEKDDKFVISSARIVYGGINPSFIHASGTESYLVGKVLSDNATLQGALAKLNDEVKPDNVLPDASPEYRKNLALALFYKFVLMCCENKVSARNKSAAMKKKRPISTGEQKFQTDQKLYPVGKPIPKLEALAQCSGEAEYISDIPTFPGELFAVFVMAKTRPLSTIKEIKADQALKSPGVVAFMDKKSIPGTNTFVPAGMVFSSEEVFSSGKILYHGQPIGMVVAKSMKEAVDGAKLVQVDYEPPTEQPYYDMAHVLRDNVKSRIHHAMDVTPKRKGNDVKHTVSGTLYIGGQYHFTMETQNCICVPTEDGYDMYPGTQWIDLAQISASQATNVPNNKFNIKVRRLGGGYGSKITRNSLISTACAIAAHKLKKPVRMELSLEDNMHIIGYRYPSHSQYTAQVDDNGKMQSLENTFHQDGGNLSDGFFPLHTVSFSSSCYDTDTWQISANAVVTDMPTNTACRAPGSTEAIAMIESIMEHIATAIQKDPIEVRKANLKSGTANPISSLIDELVKQSDYQKRRQDVETFNKENRWVKRGISLIPQTYQMEMFGPFSVMVVIYHGDGSVAVVHGGIEMGQGINTKVAQVCAYFLGIPVEMVTIKPNNNFACPNNMVTGGSVTSESCCLATKKACEAILERMKPHKKPNSTWTEWVQACHKKNVELCETAVHNGPDLQSYPVYSVCAAEVEIDVLTGEHQVLRVDILEDTGNSLNPNVDIGQIEGAFIMGMGYYMMENLMFDQNDGNLLTDRTWSYKIPGAKDIPIDFRVTLKAVESNPGSFMQSKGTAEPPLCLSISVPLAVRHALASARRESDPKADLWTPINKTTSTEFISLACLNNYQQYTL